MKKLLTAVVLSSLLLINTAFANKNENVNNRVENAFRQEFTDAKEVNWQKTNNYYKVSFKMDNQAVTAYYTYEGELMGVVRNILSTQLPVNLQAKLKNDYNGYWITELFELARHESNDYYVTIQNADQIITLESTTGGSSWTTYSRVKK